MDSAVSVILSKWLVPAHVSSRAPRLPAVSHFTSPTQLWTPLEPLALLVCLPGAGGCRLRFSEHSLDSGPVVVDKRTLLLEIGELTSVAMMVILRGCCVSSPGAALPGELDSYLVRRLPQLSFGRMLAMDLEQSGFGKVHCETKLQGLSCSFAH